MLEINCQNLLDLVYHLQDCKVTFHTQANHLLIGVGRLPKNNIVKGEINISLISPLLVFSL